MKTRIIVAGSREFTDYSLLKKNINNIIKNYSNVEIVSGTARGVDRLGEKYAREHMVDLKRFPADWNRYGKSAGYRRNEEMAQYSSQEKGVLIAFWDGQSKGTNHMINIAKEYDLEIHIIKY